MQTPPLRQPFSPQVCLVLPVLFLFSSSMQVRHFVSCFVYLFAALRLSATGAVPAMHHYTVADGLLSPEVHCIFQDDRGKIWFGTDVGVTCYDGTGFVNYTTRDGLADHTIFGISQDRRGWIWFRGYNGLLCWFDGQKIVQPAVNAALREKLKGRQVISQQLDAHDTLWMGLLNDPHWLKVLPGFTRLAGQQDNPAARVEVAEVRKGQVVLLTGNSRDTGLVFRFRNGVTQTYPLSPEQSGPFIAACLGPDRYLVEMGDSAYLLDHGKLSAWKEPATVTCIYPEKNGDYWLCGQRPGSARLMRNVNGQETIVHHYLTDHDVTSCLRDHEGGLWFGTLDNGVFYIPFPGMQEVYAPVLEAGDRITALTAWPGGGVLAGTLRGDFFLAAGGQCEPWNAAGRIGETCINCMSTLGNSVLIGGTRGSAIYDATTGKTTTLGDPGSSYGLTLKCALAYDERRWCAASIRKMYWVDKKTGKVEVLLDDLPERISSIARTRGDTLWLGGLTRLWMLVPGQEPVDYSKRFPVLSNHADELAGDTADGNLWMLSRGDGLFLLAPSGVTDLRACHAGLPPVCRKLLLLDHVLWMATSAGMCEPQPGEKKAHTFDRADGLPVNNIDLVCLSEKRIWVSGDQLLFSFGPEGFPRNEIPPQVCFRDVLCNGSVLRLPDSPVAVQFGPGENTLRFRLAAQSYKSFGQPRFLVRMTGIDDSWRVTDETDITYYSLPPGDYRFQAYALNNSGVRSQFPVSYSFSVLPPFWKSAWFIALVSVMVVLTVALLLRNYLRRFRRDETSRRRLAELEITAIRAQMNPHFIFNAINSIYNFVATGDRKASASYVARFARLIRNVLELTPLRQIPLEQELETLRLYMDIEQLRFREAFTYEIDIDPQLEPSSVQVAPMLIQPYVENAIWHGLLHKEGKGKLVISIRKEKEFLACIIDDDGVGRAQAALAKQHSLPKNSLGSLLNRRRLELLRELYGIGFDVRYVDKQEEPGTTETGTRVILRIPMFKT